MNEGRYDVLKCNMPLVRTLQRSLAVALLSHWLFQGFIYMDRTERLAKLILGSALFLATVLLFGRTWSMLFLSALVAHTLNFALAGQPWVVLKSFGRSFASAPRLVEYLSSFRTRVLSNESIAEAFVYGSYARHELHDNSDLDIRCVRHRGLRSAIGASWFVLRERMSANFLAVPLDLYVFDSRQALHDRAAVESPHCLKKREGA